jgi:hypothetical protein
MIREAKVGGETARKSPISLSTPSEKDEENLL